MTHTWRFTAMGTEAHLVVVGGGRALGARARARIEDLESKWSRFRPDSEICRLQAGAGTPVAVSDDTRLLVERGMEAWRLSGGSFDPTVLADVVRAGYDRSFELLAGGDGRPGPGADGPGRAPAGARWGWLARTGPGCRDVRVEEGTVCLPAGTGFDPGGIGKGLAADLVTEDLLAAGAAGACVNLGGDVRVCGPGPDGGGWTVDVEHPGLGTVARLGLADGAVATSTTLRRRWTSGGRLRHHLIDPGTGEPTDSDLELASVVHAHGWVAEILAKAVLLRGSAHPFDLLGGIGAEGLAVDDGGAVLASDGLSRFTAGAQVGRVGPSDARGTTQPAPRGP